MPEDRRLVQRADKVLYCGVPNGETETIYRMKGFTSLSKSQNPTEYSRQYVDEYFEQTDVTGISSSIDFAFDQYVGDPVHDYFVSIIDGELIGTDAVVTLYQVDFTKPGTAANTYACVKKEWALIPSGEGDSTDAYTYSGTFRTKSGRTVGTATVSADQSTITFTEGTAAPETF